MLSGAALGLILTQAQVNCLNMAYTYGGAYGLSQTFRAVVLVESSGCVNELGDDGRSYGASQLQIYTARQTCDCGVTPENLRTDDHYNLQLGAKFLARCFNQFWPDTRRSIYCFNAGIPAASKATASQVKNSPYVLKVLQAVRQLREVREDRG